MHEGFGRAALRIPVFLFLCSVVLVALEPRNSAQFYISIATAVISIVFLLVVTLLVKALRR